MNHPVEFHPAARLEALDARAWYADRSDLLAERFNDALDKALEEVALGPERFAVYVAATRRRLLRRFPYAVVYRVLHDRIQVVAVAHLRRRPGYWLDRL